MTQAEAAIEKQDYEAAERLLLPVVAANPKDAVAWYDLGYVYRATNRREQAIGAYRKSVAAKPDVYEANLALGLLLADGGHNDAASESLNAAVTHMPSSTPAARQTANWLALGLVQETSSPEKALAAFRKAAELSPKDIQPHLAAARVLSAKKDTSGAESEYKAALAIDPKEKAALSGLIDLYRDNGRAKEATNALRDYAKQFPDDPQVHILLGQSLLKSGNADGAMAEFDAGLKQSPDNAELLHGVAAAYASQAKFPIAAERYGALVKAAPENAQYHYQYGVVLMKLHRFPEAQEQLIAALKRDARLLEAYGELAIAASENKQYPLTIKVLEARAQLAPETPATYFLRATAYDNLKAYSQAAQNYHKFLDTSNGQFADNEWKARHRLIAIEPTQKKTK